MLFIPAERTLWMPRRRRLGWRPKRPVLNGRPPDCNCNCETVTSSSVSATSSAESSPPPIGVACCGPDLPQNLTVTITAVGPDSDCGCLVGLSTDLVYDSVDDRWEATFDDVCGTTNDMAVFWFCSGLPDFEMKLQNSFAPYSPNSGATCSPVYFEYEGSFSDSICGGLAEQHPITYEVTE